MALVNQKLSSRIHTYTHTHTHSHHLTALYPGLTRWAGTRNVKPIWILLKQRDGEWQWHQLWHMQVCTSLQTDNHTRTLPLSFLQAGCPSSRPTNSVITLKATCLLEKKENIRIVNRHLKLTELGSTGPETLHVADRQMKRLAFILNTRKHTITSVVRQLRAALLIGRNAVTWLCALSTVRGRH